MLLSGDLMKKRKYSMCMIPILKDLYEKDEFWKFHISIYLRSGSFEFLESFLVVMPLL
jgi:hypothetical protein